MVRAGVPVHAGPDRGASLSLARHFGARRKAFNWTVATLKGDIDAWRETGVETEKPSLRVLRKRWNTIKDDVCVNAETGQVWWRGVLERGLRRWIAGAVDAYWNWQQCRVASVPASAWVSRGSRRKAATMTGCAFTTGAMRVEPDRRHLDTAGDRHRAYAGEHPPH